MEKVSADLIIKNASQLLTLIPWGPHDPLGIIQNGALAVSGEKIAWVGPSGELDEKVVPKAEGRVIDAGGKVVMPGLIDPHTHLIFAGSREEEFSLRVRGASYMEIAARGGGIKSTVRHTRQASKEELLKLTLRRLDNIMALGTTTCEVKSGYGLDTETELKMLEVVKEANRLHPVDLIPTFLGAHDIPEEYKGRRKEYVRLIIDEMLPVVAEEGLAEFCDVFVEEGVFTPQDGEEIFEAAKRLGMRPRVHADELTPSGGAELAARVGAVSADHLLFITEMGMEALKEAGVVATLLPGTALFLSMGRYAPARAMIERGITVALASDFNPGSCMSHNLPLMMTLACTQMRMTPEEAIAACTINAARSLLRDDIIGSLGLGKQADIIMIDAPNYLHLIYYFGINQIERVIKKGRVVWER